ncbi:MAG: cytochrome ubiquinol oxidase subunit I [Patulibacter sp.]|nr:cytochrome ubiquinol oxidase subunit I [Patulibacter sp.]
MQAMSLAVHIPLVCFGIAWPTIVLFTEGLYLRTGDPVYKALAKRWSKVMLVLFAVGVVTGTILSFEFGLLWPNFMATYGEVFGLGFTLEGISFFVEGIFIAIYVYGWDRLSKTAHFLSGIPIAIAGVVGSLMVIAINAWMNKPGGFTQVDGRVVAADPWDALFGRGFVWHELVHMYLAGYLVCGFIVAGFYAHGWLKGSRTRYHRAALIIPLTFAALIAPVQLVVGDWAGRTVAKEQPVKLAAMEGLGQTTAGAPFHILGYYDAAAGEVRYGIKIPKLLSLLADHDPDATVAGLDAVPVEDRPTTRGINIVRFSFQAMIAIGTGLVMLAGWYLLTWWRRGRLPRSKWFFRAIVLAAPLTVVALISGWITTEVGRQPWVVYDHMRTSDAVTEAGGLPIALGVLIVVYALLLSGVVWLLRRLAAHPPETELPPEQRPGAGAVAAGPGRTGDATSDGADDGAAD